jgi:hypothetical protein
MNLLMTAENGSKVFNGTKTMTRRLKGLEVVNQSPNDYRLTGNKYADILFRHVPTSTVVECHPQFRVGDIVSIREPHYLWGQWFKVWDTKKNRERWYFEERIESGKGVYFPDNIPIEFEILKGHSSMVGWYLRPGMFMFAQHIRSRVRITQVICHRLQDISHQDITAEGLGDGYTEIGWNYAFGQLWNSINLKSGHGWDKNEWIFGYRFERVK